MTAVGYDKEGYITSVQKPGERITGYEYDNNYNVTGITDPKGYLYQRSYDKDDRLTGTKNPLSETEKYVYDAGSRRTSYTMNGGNSIRYDYDALNDLVEKTYLDENGETEETIGNTVSGENPSGVLYGYDLLGQRVSMMDTGGDSVYTYDGLGRITSVTTYRKPAEAGADTADKEDGETVRYEYDGCDQLAAIVYPDGTKVSYTYDKNDNLTAVTDRNGRTTTYVYDEINRVTEIHRPNGISTYNTYNARDQIVSLKNTCDECGWVVSQYDYTYDDNGYISTEKAVESLYDYAWDDKHNGKHEDGRHDDKMPHGTKHNGKHGKDSEYHFQLVETDREFTYDENGRLLSSKEQEENSGLTTYDYTYDAVGNRLSYVKRTQTTKHPNKTDVAESAFYSYNDSNQLVSAKLFDGKKNTTVTYTYDDNGNLISEIGAYGTDQVEMYYDYTVENRLQAVYDADELLMAAAYDGDGNRVFQLNYNLHTDEDWKDNSGNGNGNNKDNAGSGNNGNGNSSSGNNSNNGNGNGNSGNSGNGNSGNNGNSSTGNNGNPGNSGNGKGEGNTGNTGNGNSGNNGSGSGSSGNNGNDKENSKSEGTDDAGYGNATNAEEHNSQNQSGILFPIAEEVSQTETDLIAMIKTTGKEKNYELIEYISDVNTQYTQVLMELNENGAMDAAYTYGVSRLTEDRFTGESNFYLYDPAGNVVGITDQDGYLWQSYRYDAFGNATFGSPQYDNEYTFNAESYNPNIQSQYLRARYYDTVKGSFLTEDSYLGDIRNPLTLNRYSYCIGNPLFYVDPSGHWGVDLAALESEMMNTLNERDRRVSEVTDYIYDKTGEILGTHNDSEADQIVSGFVAGFAGSFYETFDLITHPEIILANVFEAVTHPIETVIGIIENKVTRGMDGIFRYLEEKNYRMVGQEAGRMTGEKVQDLIAAAVVAKVFGTCEDGKSGSETPSKAGLPDAELPEVEGKRPLLELDLQFETSGDEELSGERGSSSRYNRTGYKSNGRSNNLFAKDRSTKKTINLTEWRRSISKQDIHNEMRLFLGDDYVKVDSGKWRSLDGTRQFRVKPDDYLGNHGIGQPIVPNTSHVHFEFLAPRSNGNGFDVIKNIHVPISD